MMQALATHPYAQQLRHYVEQQADRVRGARGEQDSAQDDTFTPPVDVFSTEKAYILHLALPGAVKEDVGVNWDSEKRLLNIAGVVHRPGSEEFLQTLTSAERKIGMFDRSIRMPPESDEKAEVDGSGITARMDNGILIITVPKVEKEWTEIHKVDIE
jgi:HSP20 family protein